jgi:hypothetical protein
VDDLPKQLAKGFGQLLSKHRVRPRALEAGKKAVVFAAVFCFDYKGIHNKEKGVSYFVGILILLAHLLYTALKGKMLVSNSDSELNTYREAER